jgi:ABC-2 type transport system ATP-binding protein
MFSAIGVSGRTAPVRAATSGEAGDGRAPGASEPVICVDALTKIYEPSDRWMRFLLKSAIDHPVQALAGVSMSVCEGEVCAVVGPNGAGKSTLFRILMGLTTPSSGTATVMGLDATADSRRVRGLVGWMPADSQTLFLRHTSYQNLWFHGRLQGLGGDKLEKRIDETLEMVGLAHARNYSCHAMSTGMRARLLLARALLHRPRVLILDEPTGTVDPIGAHQLLSLIQTLTYELRIAVLLSSHRLEEIDALRDNVMFLDRGQLVHWGHLDSLRNLWELPRLVIQFKDQERAAQGAKVLAELPEVTVEALEGDDVIVASELDPGALLVHLGPLVGDIVSVTEAKMPLRDLLAKLVAERR